MSVDITSEQIMADQVSKHEQEDVSEMALKQPPELTEEQKAMIEKQNKHKAMIEKVQNAVKETIEEMITKYELTVNEYSYIAGAVKDWTQIRLTATKEHAALMEAGERLNDEFAEKKVKDLTSTYNETPNTTSPDVAA